MLRDEVGVVYTSTKTLRDEKNKYEHKTAHRMAEVHNKVGPYRV